MAAAAHVVPLEAPDVRGFLHRPDKPSGEGLVLTHGAGSDCNTPLLVTVATAFGDCGVTVLRCDLPFRQRRPKGPPAPATAAADRAGLAAAVAVLRPLCAGPVMLGGHSYGGRQASMLAAEQPELAAALLLLSYPLHPPGKPEQLRIGHFAQLRVPALFVHGTADPFATIAELEAAVTSIAAASRIMTIDGAGHDLKRGKFDLSPIVAALQALRDA